MGLEMALIYNGIKFSMVGHHTKSIQPWTKVIQQVPQTHYEHLQAAFWYISQLQHSVANQLHTTDLLPKDEAKVLTRRLPVTDIHRVCILSTFQKTFVNGCRSLK